MILSNSEILKALNEGRLVLEPEPTPRSPQSEPEKDCPYNTTAVDLRLGNEITWYKEELPISIDLRQYKFRNLFATNSDKCIITNQQPYTLYPKKLILAKTLERVELPINESKTHLAARVEGKSSYSRCGLLVHFTAPTIHSGFNGTITLELINLGTLPILLYPNMYICQLIIEEVQGIPYRNDSQFQGQFTPGG